MPIGLFLGVMKQKNNAGVHCVIIGFGLENMENKRLFSYENIKGEASEINVKKY